MPDVNSQLQHAELSIVVTRADGAVEDHGVVAAYDRDDTPKRPWWRPEKKVN